MVKNPSREYQVYLLGTSGKNALQRCLKELKSCLGGDEVTIHVICTESDKVALLHAERFEQYPDHLDFILAETTGLPYDQLFVRAISQARKTDSLDALVIADCISPSPFFDLRLAMTAYRYPHTGAVSPLCSLDPIANPIPYGLVERDLTEQKEPTDAVLAKTAGLHEYVEAPGFLPECVYLRHDFLKAQENGRLTPEHLLMSARSRGWSQVVAPHVLVGLSDSPSRTKSWAQPLLRRVGHANAIDHFLRCAPYEKTFRAFYHFREQSVALSVQHRLRRRNLHVIHSWGGGLQRWVHLYGDADKACENLVLKSILGAAGSEGIALALYRSTEDSAPIGYWSLPNVIRGTTVAHADYSSVLRQVIEEYAIDTLLVSSFVGHSLDLLRVPRNTIIVLHEFYPFCPALYIHFDGVCCECGRERLKDCFANNPSNCLFAKNTPEEWLMLREHFLKLLFSEELISRRGRVRMVAPTPSVLSNYWKLFPDLKGVPSFVISHGDAQEGGNECPPSEAAAECGIPQKLEKLRVALLGRMALEKGERTLFYLLRHLSSQVEFCLIGCGREWAAARDMRSVFYILPEYSPHQLPGILSKVEPDACLFLSIVPESFSFTLNECFANRIPAIAPRLGAFLDRIEDGVNGILVDPQQEAFREILLYLSTNREILRRIRSNLAAFKPKTARAMVSEYERIINRPSVSDRTYFSRSSAGCSLHLPESEVARMMLACRSELDQIYASRGWKVAQAVSRIARALRLIR